MNKLLITALLISNMFIPFGECSKNKDFQNIAPSIHISPLEDQEALQNSEDLRKAISQMLHTSEYGHNSSKISLYRSQKNQIAIVETEKGKKFIKIKKRGSGLNEYLGTLLFKDFASIIPAEALIISRDIELVVQPFMPSAEDDLLYYKIAGLELQDNLDTWELIRSIFHDSLNLSSSTMHYSIGNARNDEFFFNRLKTQAQDGISGRIERIYSGKKFKLMDLDIPWEELKTMHWDIDGITYRETLEELLTKSRQHLDSSRLRLMGISHGNWHENNILINQSDSPGKSDYAYIALDFAGENDLIADAAMFLTHTTVYADYLNPVYYSDAYGNHQLIEDDLQKTILMKKRSIMVKKHYNTMNVSGVGSFGTLDSRKEIAKLFHEQYFKPLVEDVKRLFGEEKLSGIDHHLESALLLRLLGGQDISKMLPQDQIKVIGLIYQSIGTPLKESTVACPIDRFIHAL